MDLKQALVLFKGKYEMVGHQGECCNMVKLSDATKTLMDYVNSLATPTFSGEK